MLLYMTFFLSMMVMLNIAHAFLFASIFWASSIPSQPPPTMNSFFFPAEDMVLELDCGVCNTLHDVC